MADGGIAHRGWEVTSGQGWGQLRDGFSEPVETGKQLATDDYILVTKGFSFLLLLIIVFIYFLAHS